MAQKGWVIWVATAVMPWCMLGWTERLRAQEGRTLVPSGPTPPAGTTRYDAAKALADALVKAAMDVVKLWRYKPYRLNDQPVEVDTEIIVNFTLGNR